MLTQQDTSVNYSCDFSDGDDGISEFDAEPITTEILPETMAMLVYGQAVRQ